MRAWTLFSAACSFAGFTSSMMPIKTAAFCYSLIHPAFKMHLL